MRSLIGLALVASATASSCASDEASSLMQLKVPQSVKREPVSLLGIDMSSKADRASLLQKVRTLAEKLKTGDIDDATIEALDGAVSTAASVLREQALPAIQTEHDASVAQLGQAADAVHACATNEIFGENAVEALGTSSNTQRGDHQTCRTEEHVVHEEKTAVCDDWTSYINDLAEPPCPLPDRSQREEVVSHLQQLERYAQAHATPAREKMDHCHAMTEELNAKIEVCNQNQVRFESAYCAHQQGCRSLSECRTTAEGQFQRMAAMVEEQVAARKIEFLTVTQIQCFLDLIVTASHSGAPVGEEQLNACADDVDTTHLDITPPALNPITPCDAAMMSRSACSADFFSTEYAAMAQHEAVEGRCLPCGGPEEDF